MTDSRTQLDRLAEAVAELSTAEADELTEKVAVLRERHRRQRAHLLVQIGAHELGHCLSRIKDGYRLDLVTTIGIPDASYGGMSLFGPAPADLGIYQRHVSDRLDSEVADLCFLNVTVTPELLELALLEVDGPAATEAALARLPPAVAASVRRSLYPEPGTPRSPSDDERHEATRPVHGLEFDSFLAGVRLKAWERVNAFMPLLMALLPTLLERRVMTGVDLDQATEALELGDELAQRAAFIATPEE